MHLKSISVKGFKSFPDRVRLDFGPGISVIVGPNGSGKSNITDAVLWALGEQSPLAVRGQTMQDVVFAGGHGVKGRSAAEVEVVIDNADGRLHSEFSEISIGRRLDRSGDGAYRLNGARCRLVDVLEVLSDSGLGKEMHSVISQGKVEAIVHSKPGDRTAMIEEAAGLTKHRKRRHRARAEAAPHAGQPRPGTGRRARGALAAASRSSARPRPPSCTRGSSARRSRRAARCWPRRCGPAGWSWRPRSATPPPRVGAGRARGPAAGGRARPRGGRSAPSPSRDGSASNCPRACSPPAGRGAAGGPGRLGARGHRAACEARIERSGRAVELLGERAREDSGAPGSRLAELESELGQLESEREQRLEAELAGLEAERSGAEERTRLR